MRISTHMTRNPVTVTTSDTLERAAALMKAGGFRRLPVVEEGKLVGILTERDLAPYAGYMELTRVNGAMTTKPLTVPSDATIEEVARRMIAYKIGGLPVMEGDKLVGIVTTTDVLKAFLHVLNATERIFEPG